MYGNQDVKSDTNCVLTNILFPLLCLDPKLWSEWEVNHWLDWCQAEFGLQSLGSDWRGLPGSELCTLDREAFLDLSSDYTAGEILREHLETMRRGKGGCDVVSYQSMYLFIEQ